MNLEEDSLEYSGSRSRALKGSRDPREGPTLCASDDYLQPDPSTDGRGGVLYGGVVRPTSTTDDLWGRDPSRSVYDGFAGGTGVTGNRDD